MLIWNMVSDGILEVSFKGIEEGREEGFNIGIGKGVKV